MSNPQDGFGDNAPSHVPNSNQTDSGACTCLKQSAYRWGVVKLPWDQINMAKSMTMVSSNHTITLKIYEERQSLVANTIGWPVGSHTNMSCPSNIVIIDKSCSSLDIYATSATSEERMTQVQKTMDYYNTLTACHDDTKLLWLKEFHDFYVTITWKLTGYPIIQDLLEIKRMHTTLCMVVPYR